MNVYTHKFVYFLSVVRTMPPHHNKNHTQDLCRCFDCSIADISFLNVSVIYLLRLFKKDVGNEWFTQYRLFAVFWQSWGKYFIPFQNKKISRYDLWQRSTKMTSLNFEIFVLRQKKYDQSLIFLTEQLSYTQLLLHWYYFCTKVM